MNKIKIISLSSIAFFVICILVFFISKSENKSIQQINSDVVSNFSSTELPFSFQYPSAWGNVVEDLSDATRGGVGKIYSLYFDNISNKIMAGGRSADFYAPRGTTEFDFTGFADQSLQEICNDYQAEVYCQQFDENKILAVRIPTYEKLCPGEPGIYGPAILLLVDLPKTEEIGGLIFIYEPFTLQDGFCEKSSSEFNDKMEQLKESILKDMSDGRFDFDGFGTIIETLNIKKETSG